MYHTIPLKPLQLYTKLTVYESPAKSTNSAQSVRGEGLDHRSWSYRFPVCRGNRLGMRSSPETVLQQPSARTPAPGGRWVFQRSLKLYSVVYFSLCPIWNDQTQQRPIVSKLVKSVHVGTPADYAQFCHNAHAWYDVALWYAWVRMTLLTREDHGPDSWVLPDRAHVNFRFLQIEKGRSHSPGFAQQGPWILSASILVRKLEQLSSTRSLGCKLT